MSRFGTRAAGGALLAVATLVAGSVVAATSATAGTTNVSARTAYYRAEPACAAVTVNHSRCLAERLVRVPKGAADARPMPKAMQAADGPAGGYTPAQLAKAYGINPRGGAGQVVGVVDAYNYPTARNDLNVFDRHYGIKVKSHGTAVGESSYTFQKYAQDGTHNFPKTNSGWAGEAAIDIEAVRSMCHLCKILLVEANSASNANLAKAVNTAVRLGATVVTNSYGGTETGRHSYDSAYKHPGVVITASSGDDGYYDWDYLNDKNGSAAGAPETPASYPWVVSVGGTALQLNDNGSRASESVWNENGAADVTGRSRHQDMGATGSGCSQVFTAPSWQQALPNYAQGNCNGHRLGNDIAALADPYTGFDVYDSTPDQGYVGWGTWGGTSVASPLIAGMWALAGGGGGVRYPASTLYANLAASASNFYDVTVGGNGWCGGISAGSCATFFAGNVGPNKAHHGNVDCAFKNNSATRTGKTLACRAATGYDGPSGVGTPVGVSSFQTAAQNQ